MFSKASEFTMKDQSSSPFAWMIENLDEEWYVCFLGSRAFRDLQADPVMYQANRDARSRESNPTKDNPIFTQAEMYWMGNLFFVSPSNFGVQVAGESVVTASGSYVTSGMPAYGPSGFWISADGTASGLDSNPIKAAYIMAPGMLHRLYGRTRHEFKEQTGDFEERKEIVHNSYQSLCRGDMVDINNEYGGGASSVFGNRSSALVLTRSEFNYAV